MKTKTAEMKFGLSTLSLSLSLLEKELEHNSAFACEAKKGRSTFSLHANHQAPTTRMEGRSRRERVPKRGAAALAALARLRGGGDDDGAAAAGADASAGAAAAPAPSGRRRRQLDDFEVKDADAVYDVVDEDEYADLVAKRRREGGEFLIVWGEQRQRRRRTRSAIEVRVEKQKESNGSQGPARGALARLSAPCDDVSERVRVVQTPLSYPM